MRPINKGEWPLTPVRNLKMIFTDWTNAIQPLIDRTGDYCHICERRVTNQIAIEHIFPQEHYPQLQNIWYNFLLICTNCNSRKGAIVPSVAYMRDYLWPHLNNTLSAFDYSPADGLIAPAPNINAINAARAQSLIDLYHLRDIATENGTIDKRHEKRIEALRMAIDRRIEYETGINRAIQSITDNAVTTGFLSMWLKVFNNIPEIRQALIERQEFYLESTGCLDEHFTLINRSPNDI